MDLAEPITPTPGRRVGLWICVLAIGAGAWAVVGSAWIFPQLSANSDEGIYLLQADTLRSGRLAPATPDTEADAFVPWFATIRDDRYILKYTPVHATVLAAGDVLPGPRRVALGFVAAAQVVAVAALAAELGLVGRTPVLAAGLFAFSPLVLQLGITYLPYGTSLALALTAMTLVLRGARLGSGAAALAGGFVWGVAFFARPYDAVLVAVIIGLGVVFSERRRPAFIRTAITASVGAVVPMLVFLAFNHAVTGDPFQLPFNLLEPADRLGFGERRALPGDAFVDYGLGEAVSALGRNLLLVGAWTGGGLVAVALAGWALLRRRDLRAPLLAILVVWPLGYTLFWGSYMVAFVWDGALFLGPYYYLPLVAAVSIGAALGLADLHRFRRDASLLAASGMVVLSLVVIVPALDDQLARSSQRVELADLLEREVTPPALVILPPVYGPYLQNPFSFLRNDPGIDGPVVYAIGRGPGPDDRVRAIFPERTAYRVELPRGWSDQPGFDPVIEVIRLDGSVN